MFPTKITIPDHLQKTFKESNTENWNNSVKRDTIQKTHKGKSKFCRRSSRLKEYDMRNGIRTILCINYRWTSQRFVSDARDEPAQVRTRGKISHSALS